jgi:hypothetical protein
MLSIERCSVFVDVVGTCFAGIIAHPMFVLFNIDLIAIAAKKKTGLART